MGSRAGRTTLGLAPTLSLTGMSPVRDGDRGLGGLPSRQPEAPQPPARPEALQAKSGPSPLGTANNGLRLLLPPVHRETKGPSSPRPVPTPDPGHCPEDDERRVFSLFLSPLLFWLVPLSLSVRALVGGSVGRDPGKVGKRASQGEGKWGSEPDTRVGVPTSGCAHGGQSLPTQGASRQRQALLPTPSSWMPLF